ncbi:BRISC complex subunit FAM175B-like [Colletes gigas]|uniref:BRISC complex subunit FAM175B-like n=1 Tax=Colletes gigas TaxID=935657 RepID=UPI001C9A85BA|nr:BRISC complex subunit FAM175B-like [Colletes gigas]XP_043266165.1 BRISC complex subunit FAM175B-like [Colletes gigas]
MADSDLLITISGAALSLLFYENVRNSGDQMGFLLGENLEFVIKTYTDSEIQIETVKTHNNIETVITCPLPDLLHDSIGRINKEKLKDFMRDKSKQVIGWFRFRRNTDLVLTMRDKILHKEFASHFSGCNGTTKNFFVTCLLSSSTNATRGTHKFKHVFLRRRRGMFEPVPLRIINLGNDSFIHDGSDYKPAPTKKSSDTPDVFTELIESLNLDLVGTSGFESVITIQKTVEQYLDKLIPELCKSDMEVAELERQVKEFKRNRIAQNNEDAEKNSVSNEIEEFEKMSPPRIESSDNGRDDRQTFKDSSTTTSRTVTPKLRNTAMYIEENVNQSKSRKTNADTVKILNVEPPANTVPELKVDGMETLSIRNRHLSMRSEIVKESICKGETNKCVGKGRGKIIRETQVSPQESPETNCVQNTSSQISYSQVTKKKIDNTRKSDSMDNR